MTAARRPCDARDTGYTIVRFDSREIKQQAKVAYDMNWQQVSMAACRYYHQNGASGVKALCHLHQGYYGTGAIKDFRPERG